MFYHPLVYIKFDNLIYRVSFLMERILIGELRKLITMDDCVGIAVLQWRVRKLSCPVMPGST